MVRVIGVGDNTVDRYTHLGLMFPGGNAVNVAVLARRAGHEAAYLGWLGDDAEGRLILDALAAEGVDASRCRVVSGPTSYSTVSVVAGERVFGEADFGVTAQLALTGDDFAFIRDFDLVHTSIYSRIEPELLRLRQAAARLSFDYSSDWTRAHLTEILPWLDVAFLSHPAAEPAAIADLTAWCRSLGPSLVVVTCGEAGAFADDGAGLQHVAVVETEVVDTLGAGDAFAARLLVETVAGRPLAAAMALAAAAAAETCRSLGAFGHGVSFPAPGNDAG